MNLAQATPTRALPQRSAFGGGWIAGRAVQNPKLLSPAELLTKLRIVAGEGIRALPRHRPRRVPVPGLGRSEGSRSILDIRTIRCGIEGARFRGFFRVQLRNTPRSLQGEHRFAQSKGSPRMGHVDPLGRVVPQSIRGGRLGQRIRIGHGRPRHVKGGRHPWGFTNGIGDPRQQERSAQEGACREERYLLSLFQLGLPTKV